MYQLKFTKIREHGVVLLSCLVFLLILLGIIRFTMTSSRLEEHKASNDFEVLTARESADTALRVAERFILEQGQKFCIKNSNDTAPDGQNKEAFCKKHQIEWANRFWKQETDKLKIALDSIGGIHLLNNGIYTKDFMSGSYGNCRPFWVCVNWSENANQVRIASQQLRPGSSATLKSIICDECRTTSGLKPRYIIERFLAKEINQMDFPSLVSGERLSIKSSEVVVFRITAVGFGNGDGGADVNTTNEVMQAIYVLNG